MMVGIIDYSKHKWATGLILVSVMSLNHLTLKMNIHKSVDCCSF